MTVMKGNVKKEFENFRPSAFPTFQDVTSAGYVW